MNKSFTFLVFILFIFVGMNGFSQKKKKKYAQLHKVTRLSIQSDTLTDYIVKLKKSLISSENKLSDYEIAETNFFLAKLYMKLNSYDVAIDYNLKALKIFRELKDTAYTAFVILPLSAMYGYTKNHKASLEYSEEVLGLSLAMKDTSMIINSYLNSGSNYIKIGNKKEGFDRFNKALELAKQAKKNGILASIYNNFGTYYYDKAKDYEKSKSYFIKSLNSIKNKQKSSITGVVYSNLATLYFYMGKNQEAILNAKTAIDFYSKKESMDLDASNAYETLIKAYASVGNADEAVKSIEKYSDIQKEIISEKKARNEAKLKILYETGKYEEKIKLLNTENELQESKIKLLDSENKYKSTKIFFILIILLILSLTLILIIFQYLKLKKSNKKIVKESLTSLKFKDENTELKSILQAKQDTGANISLDYENNEGGLYQKIVELMEKAELYKDPSLNLNKLSELLETNRTYISKAINNGSKKTFVEFINEYRVNEAKRILASDKAKLLTLDAIGEKSGFNSKSTFFRAFKSITEVTPSFFMKNAQVV